MSVTLLLLVHLSPMYTCRLANNLCSNSTSSLSVIVINDPHNQNHLFGHNQKIVIIKINYRKSEAFGSRSFAYVPGWSRIATTV